MTEVGHNSGKAGGISSCVQQQLKGCVMEKLVGMRFGRLLVLSLCSSGNDWTSKWTCRCDCGSERVVSASSLRRGLTSSCGCLRIDRLREAVVTHGNTIGYRQTPEFCSWRNMVARCHDSNLPTYQRYGAKGIEVCSRWRNSFANFLEDMGPRPSSKHSIDRWPDKGGNYEPGNCRWATQKEQARNKRNNRVVTIGDKPMALAEACEMYGVDQSLVAGRLRRGWTEQEAFSLPPDQKYRHRTNQL